MGVLTPSPDGARSTVWNQGRFREDGAWLPEVWPLIVKNFDGNSELDKMLEFPMRTLSRGNKVYKRVILFFFFFNTYYFEIYVTALAVLLPIGLYVKTFAEMVSSNVH